MLNKTSVYGVLAADTLPNLSRANRIKRVFKSKFFTKFGFIISPGSAAAYLRRGGQCYMSFVANVVSFLAVKEF